MDTQQAPPFTVPQITEADLQTRRLPACGQRGKEPAPRYVSEFDRALIDRMDDMTRTITPFTTMPTFPQGIVVGTRVDAEGKTIPEVKWAYVHQGEDDLTLVFVSPVQTVGPVRQSVVNGRTVYDYTSHTRRVYVDAAGRAYPEIDGRINAHVEKYTQAAALVLAGLAGKGGC